MSAVDPVDARQRRKTARLGSPGAVMGIVIGLLLIATGGALETRALSVGLAGGASVSIPLREIRAKRSPL